MWRHGRSGAGREHRAGSARQLVTDSGNGRESQRARRGWSKRPAGAAPGWRGGRGRARRRQSQGRRPAFTSSAAALSPDLKTHVYIPTRSHLAGCTFYTLNGPKCHYVFVFLKTYLVFLIGVKMRLLILSENICCWTGGVSTCCVKHAHVSQTLLA
jgi:hypothetical protein